MIMLLITWVALPFTLGVAAAILLPVLAPALPDRYRERIAQRYFDMSAKALQSGAVSIRENGDPALVATDRDPEFAGYKRTVDAEGHVKDPLGAVNYLNGKPFGVTSNLYSVFVPPWLCAVADEVDKAARDGMTDVQRVDLYRHDPSIDEQVQADGGQQQDDRIALASLETVPFRSDQRAVDPRDFVKLAAGSAEPDSGVRAKTYVEKSQEMFTERFTGKQILGLLAAYIVPVICIWFITSYGDAAAGGTDAVEVGVLAAETLGVMP